jgi:hypothetical protein
LGQTNSNIANGSATSVKLTESVTPPSTPFTIQIDSEQMSVIGRTTNSGGCNAPCYIYTIVRGQNGTTATAHGVNTPAQYLVAGCPTSCTFGVTETSAPPSTTPFTIQIDSEQMQVTTRTLVSGSTYNYTVTRATNGTSAAAHLAGASFGYQTPGCPTSCVFKVNETATPPSVPFAIKVDSEQMNVTARQTSGTLSGLACTSTSPCYTTTRAYNSTTAAAHNSGAAVSAITYGCPTSCSFRVNETTTPPLSVPFPIQIDSEQMNVTARQTSGTLGSLTCTGTIPCYSVTRAYNSTAAATHSLGASYSYLSIPYGYMTQTDASPSGTAVSPTSVNYTAGGCTYQESLNGSLTSPSGAVANTSSSGVVTNSAGTMTAPLTGDFKFKVTCGATTVADLDIAIALGKMKATATYSPAASS